MNDIGREGRFVHGLDGETAAYARREGRDFWAYQKVKRRGERQGRRLGSNRSGLRRMKEKRIVVYGVQATIQSTEGNRGERKQLVHRL
jgi:hypothetical protein